MSVFDGKLNRRGGGGEDVGTVGRWQLLYIAVSVGRQRIDRKDTTISIQSKAERERGIMSQRAGGLKKRQPLLFVSFCVCHSDKNSESSNIWSITQANPSKHVSPKVSRLLLLTLLQTELWVYFRNNRRALRSGYAAKHSPIHEGKLQIPIKIVIFQITSTIRNRQFWARTDPEQGQISLVGLFQRVTTVPTDCDKSGNMKEDWCLTALTHFRKL